MKKVAAIFGNFFLLTSLIIFSKFSEGQNARHGSLFKKTSRPAWINNLYCNRGLTTACNLIENNTFTTTCYGQSPFSDNCVNKWDYCFGSPQLNVFLPTMQPNLNHASMWSRSHLGMQDSAKGEGIVTALPKLTTGNKYVFSIYKRAH